jgi:hypothetical protein
MLRFTTSLSLLLLSAAPVLADVTTLTLPHISWPAETATGTQTTTAGTSDSR